MRLLTVTGLLLTASSFSFAGPLINPSGTINFDEFASPPVTCCYSSSEVTGPLNYTYVTITASGGGTVMNGDGWDGKQTSGDNLFGTQGDVIQFQFTTDISNLYFDLINGSEATRYRLDLYDSQSENIYTSTLSLTSFGQPGSVQRVGSSTAGVRFASITNLDSSNFAIDTVSFGESAATPEPASFGLLGVALSAAAVVRRKLLASKA